MRSIVRGLVLSGMVAGATPVAQAQAPRGAAEAQVGDAKLAIEYGAPPWNAARSAQLDAALPIGSAWRLGADGRTTLLLDGGELLMGGVLIERGGYGLNLRRTGANDWAFVIFDGSDTNVADGDSQWEIPATRVEAKQPASQLEVSFRRAPSAAAGTDELVVRFGPVELSAPVAAVTSEETELSIAGESATSRWFAYRPADLPAGRFVRTGRVGSFYVGDHDGAFDVDLKREGEKAVVRFTSRERAKVADRLERQLAAVEGLKARAGASPSPRVRQGIERAEAAAAELRAELDALAALPAPLEVVVPLAPAPAKGAGAVGARVVRRNDRLVVMVTVDQLAGELALDEKQLIPAAGTSPR